MIARGILIVALLHELGISLWPRKRYESGLRKAVRRGGCEGNTRMLRRRTQTDKAAAGRRRFPPTCRCDENSSVPGHAPGRALGLLRSPGGGRDLQSACLFGGGRHSQQSITIDFAECVARQFVDHSETLRDFVRCKPHRDPAEDFGDDGMRRSLCESDEPEHALTVHLSGMPTTAASSTAGWAATSASSTSTGEMLVPPRMMMSFLRDTNQSSSPSPRRIRSPVWYQPALRLSSVASGSFQ